MKSVSEIELKFGEDAKSNGDLLSAVSDYTNSASRFTLTVGDNTDTAFTLTSGANDTLTFTIDNEADYVQNDEQVISIAYNANGQKTADDLSDATNTLKFEDAKILSKIFTTISFAPSGYIEFSDILENAPLSFTAADVLHILEDP